MAGAGDLRISEDDPGGEEGICSICEHDTDPSDYDSAFDGAGIYCGGCMRRMGLNGELILPCGLCLFPVLGTPHLIEGHDYEYCQHCYDLLRLAGF